MPDALRQQLQEILGPAYILERELGGGGMSRVFIASDVELDRKVVVKVLPPELAAGVSTERFRREIQLAARLQHPHIVPLLAAGARDALLYYTMPFIDGESLRARLSRSRELPIAEATRVLREVSDALRYAHGQGVVHRDIKPENILLSLHHAQVTDFGVSKALSNAADGSRSGSGHGITSAGIALGTPAYMAPEQAAADPLVDHRADIYAVGVVGYELLTGRTPFAGLTPREALSAQITAIPDAITKHRAHVPPALATIIMRCLEKNPADRFQSADELHNELEQAATPSGAAAAPTSGWLPIGSRQRVPRPKATAIAIALVAVIAAALAFSMVRPRNSQTQWEIGETRSITNSPGVEIHPDISPDGKMVAYVAAFPGRPKVFIRQISGGRAIALGDSLEPGQFPDWSPDGSSIAYSNRNGISVVPALGGSSALLIPSTDRERYSQPEWSPDGKRLAAVAHENGVIVVFDLNDGNPREVWRGTVEGSHSPSWSPDGRLISYVAGNSGFVAGGPALGNIAPSKIMIVAAGGGTPVALTDNLSLNMSPAFTSDGEHVLFVSSRGGGRDVYGQKIDRDGNAQGAASRLTTGLNAHGISLAPNGRTLVYSSLRTTSNIWSIARRGSAPATAVMEPVTTGQQTIENLGLSPDNAWLVYDSDLSGNQDIYKVRREGGEPVRLTTDSADDFNPAWSPDGREITYHTFAKGTRDIFLMNSNGTGHKPVVSTRSDERSPRWAPDGNAIVYSDDGNLYIVRRSDRSAAWRTPSRVGQGMNASWNPTGDFISFVRAGRLMLLQVDGGTPIPLTNGTPSVVQGSSVVWSRDGKTIYFIAGIRATRRLGIWAAPVSGGEPNLTMPLTDPDRPLFRETFAVDSLRFYVTVGTREADIGALELRKK